MSKSKAPAWHELDMGLRAQVLRRLDIERFHLDMDYSPRQANAFEAAWILLKRAALQPKRLRKRRRKHV